MAVTNIHPIKCTLGKGLQYIVDGAKTRNGDLVVAFGCSTEPEEAVKQFRQITACGTGRSTILAHHIIQSFAPGEISPEDAILAGQELCRRLLKNQYQYVIATHEDHDHIHNHIIFNNTNLYTGRTFETEEDQGGKNARVWKRLMDVSDDICRELGLSVIENPEKHKGKSHYEWDMNRQGISWKTKLKWEIDECIKESKNFEEFLEICKAHNIEVVYNPEHKIDLKFRMDGQQRFTRARTLGWYYETKQIKKRIDLYQNELIYQPKTAIIDTTQQRFLDSYGLNRWAEIQNMKEASRVINVLTKYHAESETQLGTAAMVEMMKRGTLVSKLNELQKNIDILSDHIKLREKCTKYKPFYEEWKSKSKFFKKSYEKKYSSQISEYRESKATLKSAYPDEKVPTIEELREKRKVLMQQRSELNTEYQEMKKAQQEIEFARATLEKYLSQQHDVERQQKRKHGNLE